MDVAGSSVLDTPKEWVFEAKIQFGELKNLSIQTPSKESILWIFKP